MIAQEWEWVRDDRLVNPSGVQSFGSAGIDLGDIDGDSWLDLVVLDSVSLRMYRNRGLSNAITFERRLDWEIAPIPPSAEKGVPTLADLNGDGRADLILPDNQTNAFIYWQNTGNVNGNLWTRADSVVQGIQGEGFVALADLDHDSDPDAVTFFDSELMLYRNIGDSLNPDWQSEAERFSVDYNQRPNNIRFADVNEDGLLDIFAGFEWAFRDAIVSLGRNRSTSDSLLFNFAGNSSPLRDAPAITITVGDIDKDGELDLVSGHSSPFLYIWHSDFDTS